MHMGTIESNKTQLWTVLFSLKSLKCNIRELHRNPTHIFFFVGQFIKH